MPFTTYDTRFNAEVEHIAGITTTLDEVQSITVTQGRNNLSDAYRSGSITIEGRDPDSLPNIAIGDAIQVTLELYYNGSLYDSATYAGRVANFERNYGTIPALDTWTLVTEDAIAYLGRAAVTLTIPAGTSTNDAAEDICDAAGVTFINAGLTSVSTVGAITLDNANALDAFQAVANTELAYVVQRGDELEWTWRNGWTNQGGGVYFVDDPSAYSQYLTIQGLQFSSLADTVAAEVLVEVRGGATYVSGSGNTSFSLSTYDQTGTQASDLADFVRVLFTDDEPQPYQLSYLLNGQHPDAVLGPVEQELRQINIDFRGTVYQAVVMGFTLSITPEVTRATLNLLGKQQIPFFVLDDPSYGILNTNVLSY
jgi:hypothetical protein